MTSCSVTVAKNLSSLSMLPIKKKQRTLLRFLPVWQGKTRFAERLPTSVTNFPHFLPLIYDIVDTKKYNILDEKLDELFRLLLPVCRIQMSFFLYNFAPITAIDIEKLSSSFWFVKPKFLKILYEKHYGCQIFLLVEANT